MKIIIKSDNVNVRTGTGRNNKSYTIREQQAALDNGGDFAHPFVLNLEDKQPAYAPGEYTLDVSSLYVGDYNKLTLGRVKLVAMAARKVA